MAICAVVRLVDSVVENRIIAEPTDIPPQGCQLVVCDGMACDIGWVWTGTEFVNPNP